MTETTHTDRFAEFVADRRAHRAANPTPAWKKISPITGGGYVAYVPGGNDLYTVRRGPSGLATTVFDYGEIIDGTRTRRGSRDTLTAAKLAAAELLRTTDPTGEPPMSIAPDLVALSTAQQSVLERLCVGGGTTADALLAVVPDAGRATLESLVQLGFVERRDAGARHPLYHLTAEGRERIFCDHDDGLDDLSEEADPTSPERPNQTARKPSNNRRRNTVTATAAKTDAGIDVAQIHKDLYASIKRAVGRKGSETRKQAYSRFNDADGRTVAYLHDAGKKSVRVEIPRPDRGYENVRVHDQDEAAKALELVAARVAGAK